MPPHSPSFNPPIIAHRGARVRAPENTMPAFMAAREDGARWIETDVKITADGIPVLMHDDSLERTTSGRGPVAQLNWDTLSALDAGAWFNPIFQGVRVPLLKDLLIFARDTGMSLNLEIKPCPGRTRATTTITLNEIAKIWPEQAPPVLISSYDIEALMSAARMQPDWARGLLLDKWREDWQIMMRETGASTLHLDESLLTPERLVLLESLGVPTLAYTVNDPVRARTLLGKGVRAIFSDTPASLIAALA